jgi:hypothetical protein
MGALTRVQRAIEAPTAEAQRLLAEAPNADDNERLTIFMNGWFKGLAAALEELALELDAMRDQTDPAPEEAPPVRAQANSGDEGHEPDENAPRAETESLGEAALADRARASRAETQALREERDLP